MLGLALLQNKEYPEGIKHLEKVTVHLFVVPSFSSSFWVVKNQYYPIETRIGDSIEK